MIDGDWDGWERYGHSLPSKWSTPRRTRVDTDTRKACAKGEVGILMGSLMFVEVALGVIEGDCDRCERYRMNGDDS